VVGSNISNEINGLLRSDHPVPDPDLHSFSFPIHTIYAVSRYP